uniref:Uncharacterized protein n=1 Tax=Anopheles farauti TaxID=69004 RepID=A0A182QJ76_9DIPT
MSHVVWSERRLDGYGVFGVVCTPDRPMRVHRHVLSRNGAITFDWLSFASRSSFALSNFSLCISGNPAPITSGSGSSCIDSCGDMAEVTSGSPAPIGLGTLSLSLPSSSVWMSSDLTRGMRFSIVLGVLLPPLPPLPPLPAPPEPPPPPVAFPCSGCISIDSLLRLVEDTDLTEKVTRLHRGQHLAGFAQHLQDAVGYDEHLPGDLALPADRVARREDTQGSVDVTAALYPATRPAVVVPSEYAPLHTTWYLWQSFKLQTVGVAVRDDVAHLTNDGRKNEDTN